MYYIKFALTKLPRTLLLWLVISGLIIACAQKQSLTIETVKETGWKSKVITQDDAAYIASGDPVRGFEIMTSGVYLGSGIPAEFFKKRFTKDTTKFLQNTGLVSPYGIAFFDAPNGVEVANGTCFTCHAGAVAGDTILGMGNSLGDYRGNIRIASKLLNTRMKTAYKKTDPAFEQYHDFGKYFAAMSQGVQTNNPGVNPAARIAETIMRHRDPVDLTYVDTPLYNIASYNIASDTPPLWNVAKKNSLYYTAVGRGDMTKLIFQASVLGIPDSSYARQSQEAFVDVLAWIKALKPPKYPFEIDLEYAKKGKLVFEEHCSGCHGTYGKIGGDRSDDTYPNKVLSVDVVKTDPVYASYAVHSEITDWYNKSWFATSNPQSRFEPEAGYVAPPLDGVWATAPYLHNGSVPTIEHLLNSETRPEYWTRKTSKDKPSGKTEEYDQEKLGWKTKAVSKPKGRFTYDTSLPGYSNQGHYFGDKLSNTDRSAVIEYLKTL